MLITKYDTEHPLPLDTSDVAAFRMLLNVAL